MKHIKVDYVIVGAGVAGLSCALEASKSGTVAVVTKEKMLAGNTPLAQGGIAAALGEGDTHELHIQDTLRAGAGECNPDAVEVLIKEGTDRVQTLLKMGFPYDKGDKGKPLLGREGAHSVARVISARGDGSGKALSETLLSEIQQQDNVMICEQILAVELLVIQKRCIGLLAYDLESSGFVVFSFNGVVLATGGCGQIFKHTTNNLNCTGDGFALASRAGAELENMEFVQFHPTALNMDENPMFLISEAVRGKGAVLLNNKGERFMTRYHPWAELAPRDVVARGIFSELTLENQVFLDVTSLGRDFKDRVPSIFKSCCERGISLPEELIPVVPAAHFMMGGIKTDLSGRTNIEGLYACGEVASTGVHGANRLASNSLLEGLVFGCRVGRALAKEELTTKMYLVSEIKAIVPFILEKIDFNSVKFDCDSLILEELRKLMWVKVGLVRSGKGLSDAVRRINEMEVSLSGEKHIILRNMMTVAGLIAKSALARRDSRGSHFRSDSSANWEASGYLQNASSI